MSFTDVISPAIVRGFSAVKKCFGKVRKSQSARSLSDHWMKLVAIGSITAGILIISVPAALITFGVLFFALETVAGKMK